MGVLRDRNGDHDGRRTRRFLLRARGVSIGTDYWVEDEQGDRAFLVDGKAARVRDTWVINDAEGREVATVREKKLSIRDAVKIHFEGREATVRRSRLGIGERFHVEIDGERGGDLKVKGDFIGHDFEIERDGHRIAEVSKKWFRVRDTFGVEVADDADTVLVLAVVVAVDSVIADSLMAD